MQAPISGPARGSVGDRLVFGARLGLEVGHREIDVLAKWDTPPWNEQTRRVVEERLREVPERRFLRPDEWETLEAICARGGGP